LILGTHRNTISAIGAGLPIGPSSAEVTVRSPVLSLDKTASPLTLTTGENVVYNVTILNTGNADGVVQTITDTLPEGFQFLRLDPASDLVSEPADLDGALVWTGPFTVPQGSDVNLIYQVRSSGVGSKVNSVVVRDSQNNLVGPKGSAVTTNPALVYAPLILRNYQIVLPSTLPMEETFDTGVPPEWTAFVNSPGLSAADWFWVGDVTWGRYDYVPDEPLNQWALSMYLGQGAQDWTDYRIEATIRPGKVGYHPLVGIWFRGTYQEQTDLQGGDVTGYALYVRPDKDLVYLGRIDPNTRKLDDLTTIDDNQYDTDIWTWYNVTIDVQGARIKIWIDGIKLFDWTDPNATWMQGTVGFVVYRGSASFDYIRVSELE
jgi:uncharacterized repeat protein (TIGR01451 family)